MSNSQAVKKYRYGFIALNRNNSLQMEEQSCLALVSIINTDLSFFFLDEILLLGFNPGLVSKKVMSFNVTLVGIDEENYEWLANNWDQEINLIYQSRPDRRGKFPVLQSYERDKDLFVRQLSTVEDLFTNKKISTAGHLQQNSKWASLITAWGTSVVADAVAGALMVAKEQAEIIKFNQIMANQKQNSEMWQGRTRQ